MRRGVVSVLVVAVLASAGVALWQCRSDPPPARRTAQRTGKIVLDYAAIRRERDARVAKAKALVARYNPQAHRKKPDQPSENMHLVEPFCLLGSPDTCLALVPLIEDCDAKQGAACLALGQFLSETPPRALIAPYFFHLACRAGAMDGCDRWEELKAPSKPCDEDPFACGWAAYRSGDPIRQDQACMTGFGEVCLVLGFQTTDDDDLRRDYFELACQQDARGGCSMLGRLLAPGCEDDDEPAMWSGGAGKCLPSDQEASAQANALACEAGMAEACE
jgi:hypothetical protein